MYATLERPGMGSVKTRRRFRPQSSPAPRGGGGTVFLPPGHYLTGAVTLRSHITLDVGPGAVILGSENPADYPLHENVYGGERKSLSSLIYVDGVEDITLTGRGTIDGQGQVWVEAAVIRISQKEHAASTSRRKPG